MFEAGQIIQGGYKLIEFVGRGGFGEVWRALDTGLESEIALKFITRLPRSEDAARMVLEEGQKLRMLSTDSSHEGCRHIVYVHRGVPGKADMPSLIDMEWLGGGDLQRRLVPGVPMAQNDILNLAIQIGQALHCAHSQEIIHCDVKPSNVLLKSDGKTFKLSDFGLARSIGAMNKEAWGTPAYMSPEQFLTPEEIVPESDIYSLGVLLYQCAEGNLPFEGRNWQAYKSKHCESQVPAISNPLISDDLKELILQCLTKDRQHRPTSARLVSRIKKMISFPREDEAAPTFQNLKAVELRESPVPDRPVILHEKTGVEFVAGSAMGHYACRVLITNQDFLKFVNEPDFRRWRPGSLPFAEHDGGYLQHWFIGKPSESGYKLPVTGLNFSAARTFARWMGGDLPSLSEMDALFFGKDFPWLAEEVSRYALQAGLPAVQFWCRDPVNESGDLCHMWRVLPQTSPLAHPLTCVRRPRFYGFPHYLLLVVLSSQVVARVMDMSSGRPAAMNTGPASSWPKRTHSASATGEQDD